MPVDGAANINGGVVVSMANLTSIEVSEDASLIKFGAGCNWDSVYAALLPHNRTAVGGRMGLVGVAGFLLGGGVGFLGNQYGFAAASVVEHEASDPLPRLTRALQPPLTPRTRSASSPTAPSSPPPPPTPTPRSTGPSRAAGPPSASSPPSPRAPTPRAARAASPARTRRTGPTSCPPSYPRCTPSRCTAAPTRAAPSSPASRGRRARGRRR